MAAFEYYANATQYVMKSHDLNENYLVLLQEALAPLRFYLSCRVCNKILENPMTPDHTACQHTVCVKCIGGKMRLKPLCGWCKTYENFVENKSLSALINCYAKLCQYVISSSEYRKQREFVVGKGGKTAVEGAKEKVAALLKEGCDVIPSVSGNNKNNSNNSTTAGNSASSNSSTICSGATTPLKAVEASAISTSDNNANISVLSANQMDTPTTPLHGQQKGDLKLKLVIPSGKKRRWYTTTIQNQPTKISKKKGNTTLTRKDHLLSNNSSSAAEPLLNTSASPSGYVMTVTGSGKNVSTATPGKRLILNYL